MSVTLDQFLREQQIVNVNTMAKAANVTKSYLYTHQDGRERVEALRAQQGQERLKKLWEERQQHQPWTDKTKNMWLAGV